MYPRNKNLQTPQLRVPGSSSQPRGNTRDIKPKSSKAKWSDPSFEPSEIPLPRDCNPSDLVWLRPEELSKNPALFVDGVDSGDVQQGALGDCWLVGSFAILASAEGLVEKLFVETNSDEGKYTIQLFWDDKWVRINIDDRLPCSGRRKAPYFASCVDPNEFWVPLLEKAFAKLFGSYAALERSPPAVALSIMTGEPASCSKIQFEYFNNSSLRNQENTDRFWSVLEKFFNKGYLMACSIDSDLPGKEKTAEGLVKNHCYSLLSVANYRGNRLIRLRNPWGEFEWNGRWSDHSKEWTPEAQRELNFTFGHNGTFYMCVEDFVSHFHNLTILRMMIDDVGKKWEKHSFVLRNCKSNEDLCEDQDQIFFRTSSQQHKICIWIQPPRQKVRYGRSAPKNEVQCIVRICDFEKTDLNSKKRIDSRGVRKICSYILQGNPYLIEMDALPNSDYFIFGSTNQSQAKLTKEQRLPVSVYSEEPLEQIQLYSDSSDHSWSRKSVDGRWSVQDNQAGGCANHPTWRSNPRFLFIIPLPSFSPDSVSQLKKEIVTVGLKVDNDVGTIGYQIFPIETVTSYDHSLDNSNSNISTYLSNTKNVSDHFTLNKHPKLRRKYENISELFFIILPTTWNPGTESKFTLDIWCSFPTFTLQRLEPTTSFQPLRSFQTPPAQPRQPTSNSSLSRSQPNSRDEPDTSERSQTPSLEPNRSRSATTSPSPASTDFLGEMRKKQQDRLLRQQSNSTDSLKSPISSASTSPLPSSSVDELPSFSLPSLASRKVQPASDPKSRAAILPGSGAPGSPVGPAPPGPNAQALVRPHLAISSPSFSSPSAAPPNKAPSEISIITPKTNINIPSQMKSKYVSPTPKVPPTPSNHQSSQVGGKSNVNLNPPRSRAMTDLPVPSSTPHTNVPKSNAQSSFQGVLGTRSNYSPTATTLPKASDQVIALWDREPETEADLRVVKGDIITVISRPGGWWKGQIGERVGIFPHNLVSEI